MIVHCPNCLEELSVDAERREITCSACGEGFDLRARETVERDKPERDRDGDAALRNSVSQTDVATKAGEPRPRAFREGDAVDGYVLERRLGKGGMGVVFLATQRSLGRKVAIKFLAGELARDAEFLERFDREAQALANLQHPNLVGVIDRGQHAGIPYLVMEFVDGVALRDVMSEKTLSAADALRIVPQVCEALEYAHDRGIVHRDVKPENILIARDGTAKIADFGLARLVGKDAGRITRSNVIMGSVDYMAPEQREKVKDADHRADIYSLGVVLYEMLTGELPLGRFPPPSNKCVELDVDIDRIVLRVLEKDPDKRYQRASDIAVELKRSCDGRAERERGAEREREREGEQRRVTDDAEVVVDRDPASGKPRQVALKVRPGPPLRKAANAFRRDPGKWGLVALGAIVGIFGILTEAEPLLGMGVGLFASGFFLRRLYGAVERSLLPGRGFFRFVLCTIGLFVGMGVSIGIVDGEPVPTGAVIGVAMALVALWTGLNVTIGRRMGLFLEGLGSSFAPEGDPDFVDPARVAWAASAPGTKTNEHDGDQTKDDDMKISIDLNDDGRGRRRPHVVARPSATTVSVPEKNDPVAAASAAAAAASAAANANLVGAGAPATAPATDDAGQRRRLSFLSVLIFLFMGLPAAALSVASITALVSMKSHLPYTVLNMVGATDGNELIEGVASASAPELSAGFTLASVVFGVFGVLILGIPLFVMGTAAKKRGLSLAVFTMAACATFWGTSLGLLIGTAKEIDRGAFVGTNELWNGHEDRPIRRMAKLITLADSGEANDLAALRDMADGEAITRDRNHNPIAHKVPPVEQALALALLQREGGDEDPEVLTAAWSSLGARASLVRYQGYRVLGRADQDALAEAIDRVVQGPSDLETIEHHTKYIAKLSGWRWFDDEARDAILSAAATRISDGNPRTRQAAATVLATWLETPIRNRHGKLADAEATALTTLLRSPDAGTRVDAYRLLDDLVGEGTPSESAYAWIRRGLRDESVEVRRAAHAVTGLPSAFHADAAPAEREALIAELEGDLEEQKGRLVALPPAPLEADAAAAPTPDVDSTPEAAPAPAPTPEVTPRVEPEAPAADLPPETPESSPEAPVDPEPAPVAPKQPVEDAPKPQPDAPRLPF